MRRFLFDTFEVDSSNEEAHGILKDIACGHAPESAPSPVLIHGTGGKGKTHLLYAVVNRVRHRDSRTGLAYISSRDFPPQVRALTSDPGPVKRAEHAILLIDDLDQFTEYLEELEALVLLFLSQGHHILMASAVPPDRLHNLPETLRERIMSGTTIDLCKENQTLTEEHMLPKGDDDVPVDSAESDEHDGGADSQGNEYSDDDIKEILEEIDTLRGENALLRASRLKRPEKSRSTTPPEVVEAPATPVTVAPLPSPELELLKRDLVEAKADASLAREESAKAKDDGNAFVAQIEDLLSDLETTRANFAESQAQQQEQVREIEAILAEQSLITRQLQEQEEQHAEEAHQDSETREELLELRKELQETRDELCNEINRAHAEVATACEKRDSLVLLNTELNTRHAEMEHRCAKLEDQIAELGDSNDELESQNGRLLDQMEALRRQASAQISDANARADLGHAASDAAPVPGVLHQHDPELKKDIEALRKCVADISDWAEQLAKRIDDSQPAVEHEDDLSEVPSQTPQTSIIWKAPDGLDEAWHREEDSASGSAPWNPANLHNRQPDADKISKVISPDLLQRLRGLHPLEEDKDPSI